MRLSVASASAYVGDIEIRGAQQVVEFEARDRQSNRRRRHGQNPTQAVSPTAIDAIQCRTAIVVPCKDEPLSRILCVWAGIPASSLIISVSASAEHKYADERDALAQFCRDTGRNGISVHQRDRQLAKALAEVGMTALLDESGLVHEGKGEALVVGIALAATAPGPGAADEINPAAADTRTQQTCHGHNKNGERNGSIDGQEPNVRCGHGNKCGTINGNGQQCRGAYAARDSGTCRNKQPRGCAAKNGCRTSYYKYIGFIDADNFVSGSVSEYCKAFSAGFHLASAQDAMVRINWGSKPKVHDGQIVFKTSGRSSEVVNRHLNQLLHQLEMRGRCVFSGDACERVEGDGREMELHHICTANAGEHAMTLSLALKLRLANGYAIEPFHFLDIFERFAGEPKLHSPPCSPVPGLHSTISSASCSPVSTPTGTSPVSSSASGASVSAACRPLSPRDSVVAIDHTLPTHSSKMLTTAPKVQILQIRTMNPHFHDTGKGDAHIARMWAHGLSVIYHSPFTADFAEFRKGLWEAILAGKVRTDGGAKTDAFPPTPPRTNHASHSASPPSGLGASPETSGANFKPEGCRTYPAAADFDLVRLRDTLLRDSTLLWWSGELEEGQEDEHESEYDVQDAVVGCSAGYEPAHERLPQRVPRRDSGVDFGMDGTGQTRPTLTLAPEFDRDSAVDVGVDGHDQTPLTPDVYPDFDLHGHASHNGLDMMDIRELDQTSNDDNAATVRKHPSDTYWAFD
ncbi:hypothetical protein Daus18300_013880 [Diaporthe australafricana]|uniref:Uncharacterized protein n=1 Tax=Diaporthe australafricana TaxID=127596 RepID=A0ABR3VXM3_9PEZI